MNRLGLLFTCPIIMVASAAMFIYLPANNASVAMHLFLVFVWSLVIWIRYRARPVQQNSASRYRTEVNMLDVMQSLVIMTTLIFTVATLISAATNALANTPHVTYIETLSPVTWITVFTCGASYVISVIQSSMGTNNNTSTDSVTANVWLEVILAATCAQAALIALVVFMYYQPQ